MVLIENYCAQTDESGSSNIAILNQIGAVVTNEDENIKFTFRQFAYTEIIDSGTELTIRTHSNNGSFLIVNSELILHFDIKCSLRLGTFPGCPPSLLPESRQSGVVTSSNFDWSASWAIETQMTADQAIELTQDGILLSEKPKTDVLLDTETVQSESWKAAESGSGNTSGDILDKQALFIIFLFSSLF